MKLSDKTQLLHSIGDMTSASAIHGADVVANREQELWAMALWVEKHHGSDGWLYIAQRQDKLLEQGEMDGAAIWKEVSTRFDKLQNPSASQ